MSELLKTCVLIAIVVSLSGSAVADDFDLPEHKSNFKPYSVISVGYSYRIDETYYLSHTPTYQIRYMVYVTEHTALKMGIGHNFSTRVKQYSSVDGAKAFLFHSGVRYRTDFTRKLFPYIELGFEYIKYENIPNGTGFSSGGPNLSIGTEIALSDGLSLDFGLNHTINHVNDGTVYINAINNPVNENYPYYSSGYEHFQNPGSYHLLLLIRL